VPQRKADLLRPTRLGPTVMSARARHLRTQLEEIFLQEGFQHLSIAQLATRLHCSRRTFYELAPTREELVLVVLDGILYRMAKTANDHLADIEDPLDRFEAFIVRTMPELHRMSLRFHEDVERQPSARRVLADHYRYATALVEDMVEEAIYLGRAREFDPQFVGQAVHAMVVHLHDPDYQRRSPLSFEGSFYELVRFVRAALERPDAKPVTPKAPSRVPRHPPDGDRPPPPARSQSRRRK
jgi:AcrR family transcriptional regulator